MAPRPQEPERVDFVFHVYVDPLFGDDDHAFELNPGNPNDLDLATFRAWPTVQRPRPLDRRGDFNPSNNPEVLANAAFAISGFLQHAPYSFRTLSGAHGALEYVYRVFDDPNAPAGSPLLPYTSTRQGLRRVTHVVIQCMPGLYGPRNPNLPITEPEIDPRTGLPWNGEKFPIELGGRWVGNSQEQLIDDRVSIQGTSALDTIFDGRGSDTTLPLSWRSSDIFRVHGLPRPASNAITSHGQAFIDGVTIRGARSLNQNLNEHGAGIHIVGNGSKVGISVTNCFFIDNVAGIVLDAFGLSENGAPRWGQHEPQLVNNTFFGNQLGIWCGQLTLDTPPAQGVHANVHSPLVINNLFFGNVSAFEGIRNNDLLVGRVDDAVLPTPTDFNAWSVGGASTGYQPLDPNWDPATNPQVSIGLAAPPVPPAPRVNLAGVANLFVRDALFGATGADVSPHDLRLSPFVSTAPTMPPGNMSPLMRNPLLGMGVSAANVIVPGPPWALSNVSGTGFDLAPGLPPDVEEAPIHGWDFDCEGFGNSRLQARSGGSPVPYGAVDIGADQCGDLILAGYADSTRLVAACLPWNGQPSHDRLYYLDQPGATSRPRPDSSFVFDLLTPVAWYANASAPPAILPAPFASLTYYTAGVSNSVRGPNWLFPDLGPFPRNLACDFSPHLLWDPHSFWNQHFSAFIVGFATDPFASNPYYHSPWPNPFAFGPHFPDNAALFHNRDRDPGTGFPLFVPHGDATWPFFRRQQTWVDQSHINPPGSAFFPSADDQFLVSPGGQFGPFGPCGTTYSTGPWGLNDACPDVVPALQVDIGLRANLEVPRSRSSTNVNSNMQTVLILPNGGAACGLLLRSGGAAAPRSSGLSLAGSLNLPIEFGSEVEFERFLWLLNVSSGTARGGAR
ncbi:MAG: hypothetical protein IPK26_18690 [Planctomycetes bacterium]|nr:hypothetical protein [Planctomycetota bacterium]